jgi:glyoxylase-like metal-dependent hydrolase (beta-lactamase superfamily II)
MHRKRLWALSALLLAAGCAATPNYRPGSDMHFIAGGFDPAWGGPDGNSIVFDAPGGLIVVDSGRHPEHQARILGLARSLGKPIVTLVNTHWHLDHSGGNAELRAAYPGLRLVATRAVEEALEGFLAKGLASSATYLADPKLSELQKRDVRLDADAIRDRRNLVPDQVVDAPTSLQLRGRKLQLRLARAAATAADIWLYDPATGTALVGDLITLPVPFLDTACPEGWSQALGQVAALPLAQVVPGHGPILSPAEFSNYRAAFEALLDCAKGKQATATCGDRWIADLGVMLPEGEHKRARAMIAYYLEARLRPLDKRQEYCVSED